LGVGLKNCVPGQGNLLYNLSDSHHWLCQTSLRRGTVYLSGKGQRRSAYQFLVLYLSNTKYNMENTDLRKTGAENIIGKFSKKHSSQHIIPVRTVRSSWNNIYMTARQAETILMLSDFLKNPSGDSKH
jgi:hypothetical protein